ncbi:MAG TPA: hypothetical protein VNI01_12150 [Elusimicrobiota bacterium]|jgi:hypothetical protein|nr:hypothetical protein [Elusimicrobiota bacterium]
MSAEQAVPFPEIGVEKDPRKVPWRDAVVWSERVAPDGGRVYEWLTKEHIRSVSWTSGTVSIHISESSILSSDLVFLEIQAPFVAIGKNVPVG